MEESSIKKALSMLNEQWGENWDLVQEFFGEELASEFDKAILENEESINN